MELPTAKNRLEALTYFNSVMGVTYGDIDRLESELDKDYVTAEDVVVLSGLTDKIKRQHAYLHDMATQFRDAPLEGFIETFSSYFGRSLDGRFGLPEDYREKLERGINSNLTEVYDPSHLDDLNTALLEVEGPLVAIAASPELVSISDKNKVARRLVWLDLAIKSLEVSDKFYVQQKRHLNLLVRRKDPSALFA